MIQYKIEFSRNTSEDDLVHYKNLLEKSCRIGGISDFNNKYYYEVFLDEGFDIKSLNLPDDCQITHS